MANMLILDENSQLRKGLSAELVHDEYKVTSIGNAESLWNLLSRPRSDLVLLNYYPNGFRSWELFHDLKDKYPTLLFLIYVFNSADVLRRLKHAINTVLGEKLTLNPGFLLAADVA